jgi:hypothetical protein
MIRHIGVHGADDGDVVDAFGGAGEQFADLDAALAVTPEFERGGEGGAGAAFGGEGAHREGFAGEAVEGRAWDRRCRRGTAPRS